MPEGSAILQSVRAAVTGSNSGDVAVLVVMLLLMAPLAPAFTLPMVFKFGVEKGRVANYILIIIKHRSLSIPTTLSNHLDIVMTILILHQLIPTQASNFITPETSVLTK